MTRLVARFITQVGLRLAFHLPRRRALLIGIQSGIHVRRSDSSKTEKELCATLKGPSDDVSALKALLVIQGYNPSDIVCLTDDPDIEERLQPTYANIMRELDSFTVDQEPGDIFFFGYAGHSSRKPRVGYASTDLLDTYIIPADGEGCLKDKPDYSKVIFAQVLKQKLVKTLHAGSRLIAVLDTCHSASLLDLPHCKCNRIASWRALLRRCVRWSRELFEDDNLELLSHGPVLPRSGSCISSKLSDQLQKLRRCSGYCPRPWTPVIPVLCISACKDSQVVYEDLEGKSLARTFVDVLHEHPRPSLAQLMRACNQKSQDIGSEPDCTPWHPQLSSLAPLNMRAPLAL
ncbi:caspase domain-containing protein [Mycena vitilis]|nr:caspase domain-containing protein [Mycena vitilis]